MSVTLEGLQQDLQVLSLRKEQAMQNFHQIVGAISIIEQLIASISKAQEAMSEEDSQCQEQEQEQPTEEIQE
jgi:hypothetical protein